MSLIETRSGGNATGLPAGSLTRRSALRGSAAAAIVLAAGVTATRPASATDAALNDLACRLETLIAAEREVWDRRSTAEDAVMRESPPTPERRATVYPFEVDGMTWEDRFAFLARSGGYNVQVAAAMTEHEAALVEHARAVAAIEKRHGLPRLERQADRLSAQVADMSEALSGMVATSPAGVVTKARMLLALAGGDPLSNAAELDRHAPLLASLLQDAARLDSGRLA